MRTIEKQIVDYVRNSEFVKNSRFLSCRDVVRTTEKQKRVYLWENCIFAIDKEGNIKFSFQGWQTPTTKGRINAFLQAFTSDSTSIYQKKGQLIFTSDAGKFPIDSNRVYMVVDGKPEATEL